MPHSLSALVAALLCALFAPLLQDDPASTPPMDEPVRHNVVVVVIDDLSTEDYDALPLPRLAALEARGRRYTNFYVHPICSPSRYALQFGRQGVHVDMLGPLAVYSRGKEGADPQTRSIADAFGAAGYATALFGKWHLSSRGEFRASSGPESLYDCVRSFGYEHWWAGHPTNLGLQARASQYLWTRCDDGKPTDSTTYASEAVVDSFVEWWRSDEERPRFTVVNLFTPHEPFSRPPNDLLPKGHDASATVRSSFETATLAVDALIGRMLDAIDLSNTYVVVLPDNGTPREVRPPQYKSRGYKYTVWQGGVNVPLLVAGPGVVAGPSAQLAHVVDLPATLLEACGLPPDEAFVESRSFAASLSGPAVPREPVVVLARRPGRNAPLLGAVVDHEGFKFVDNGGERFLFDLKSDPWEARPVNDRERARALREVLAEYRAIADTAKAQRLRERFEDGLVDDEGELELDESVPEDEGSGEESGGGGDEPPGPTPPDPAPPEPAPPVASAPGR
jgi:arylsulfatase A-like enzyme